LYTIDEIINKELFDISKLDEKYEEFLYDWFIDNIFPANQSTMSREEFIKSASQKDKFQWLYDAKVLREKVLDKIQYHDY